MFPELKLKSAYFSHSENIVEKFFIPVLKNAIKFDRVSAYFSAKALSLYSEGLEYFGKEGHTYRLIISKDISKEDFDCIRKGYEIRDSLSEEMILSLRQDLSLSEEKNISNLAYLISLGVVDIKIAFQMEGIFHDKGGIVEDAEGNKICFFGSNNETAAASLMNYEAFNVSCSWLDCNGFYLSGIRSREQAFEELWNNKKDGIVVIPAKKAILQEIMKYNKGKIIVDEALIKKNSLILDYDDCLKLVFNVDNHDFFFNSLFFKTYIKRKTIEFFDDVLYFRHDLSYIDFQNIAKLLESKVSSFGFNFCITRRLKDFIESRDIHIEERRKLGVELKSGSNRFEIQFKEFLKILNQRMSRKLRPQQAKDAFFMLAMQKSGNFSVPGSGKTTSVLAVYCYLKSKGLVDRIVVVGPKNCFKSWRDEFNTCFNGKEKLSAFDVQDSTTLKNSLTKKNHIKYNVYSYNMFLFNYEIVGTYEDVLMDIVKSRTLLVYDEVHRVKRVKGEYATHALNVAKESNYTIALTGTPIPNSYRDLYNFLHILFPNEYRNFFNFSEATLSNPSDLDIQEINKKIQPFFCRTTKQQLCVPAPNEDLLNHCDTTSAEQMLFDVLCKKYRRDKLSLFIRILQLETNPKLLLRKLELSDFAQILDITDNIDDIGYADFSEDVKKSIDSIDKTSKRIACVDSVKKIVESGKTVIVWCVFQNSIEEINYELNEIGISSKMIYGATEQSERESILAEFKSGKFQVLVTNPHTLAESVSLHDVCHDAVYFEYSYNLVHLLQSKDRIHRLGLPEGQYTQYHYMQSWFTKDGIPFSLDDAIYRRLLDKEQTMLNAIDNNVLEKVTTPEEDIELIFKDLF